MLKFNDLQFFAFNIYDIYTRLYFSFNEYINEFDIPHTPILYKDYIFPESVQGLLELADRSSMVNPKRKK